MIRFGWLGVDNYPIRCHPLQQRTHTNRTINITQYNEKTTRILRRLRLPHLRPHRPGRGRRRRHVACVGGAAAGHDGRTVLGRRARWVGGGHFCKGRLLQGAGLFGVKHLPLPAMQNHTNLNLNQIPNQAAGLTRPRGPTRPSPCASRRTMTAQSRRRRRSLLPTWCGWRRYCQTALVPPLVLVLVVAQQKAAGREGRAARRKSGWAAPTRRWRWRRGGWPGAPRR